jgi:predicted nucleotidyltransferase
MDRKGIDKDEIITTAVEGLRTEIPVVGVFLFGSYLDGSHDKDSDLDLAVYSDVVAGLDIINRAELWSRLQKAAGGWPVELHLFAASALDDPDPRTFAGHVALTGQRVG